MRTGFRDEGGRTVYYLHGKRVSKARFDHALPAKPILGGATHALATVEDYRRGRVLESVSVTPQKAQELRDFYAKRDVKATVRNDGTVVVYSKKAERAAAESRGFYNRNGGYSDARQGAHPESVRREEWSANQEANEVLELFRGGLQR